MPTFAVKFQGHILIDAVDSETAIESFKTSSTPFKASSIKDNTLFARRVLSTKYFQEIEADEKVALCYQGIPIFHVFKNFDAGPDFWTPSSNWFSWKRHDTDAEWSLGAQFNAFSEIAPPTYEQQTDTLYIGEELEGRDDVVTQLCSKIEQELRKPQDKQACRDPF